jgi:MFS transporter, ACS family, tartrate transporter
VPATSALPDVAQRARRRVFTRLMPLLFILYVVNFLDRVNVTYAALDMTRDLHFSDKVYGFGAGVFFLGYLILEVPGAIIVERWSARKWIARIMVSWGLVTILTAFVDTPRQFFIARFSLGLAESGFFTGILVYMRHWFVAQDRAKAVAMFMAAIPLSNIFGSPLAGLILRLRWLGQPGWRWLFLLEGIPAILLGLVVLFLLTDRPHQARWLPEDERTYLTAQLHHDAFQHGWLPDSWRILLLPSVLLLIASCFLHFAFLFGLLYWLPTLLKRASGLPNLTITLLVSIPYFIAFFCQIANGWHSDRTGERRWHAALPLLIAGVALAILPARSVTLAQTIFLYSIASAGIYAYLGPFWAHTSNQLRGSVAAGATGSINAIASIGGFVGPFIVGALNTHTGSSVAGVIYLTACAFASGLLLLLPVHKPPVTPAATPQSAIA